MYVCADQQSDQWLSQAINGNQLEEETKLKVRNGKDLSKTVKMALRTRNKQYK
jgi:hypothetical protein